MPSAAVLGAAYDGMLDRQGGTLYVFALHAG